MKYYKKIILLCSLFGTLLLIEWSCKRKKEKKLQKKED